MRVLAALLMIVCFSCRDDIRNGEVHEQELDTNRLVKVPLATDFDEPTEIAITKEGKVIITERKGGLKLYDPASHSVKLVTNFPVYSGQEDGLLGIALDPAFDTSRFIYLYYSPVGSVPMQRVSRFSFAGDSLNRASEKVMIEIPTQREECCHSAGSLAFGPNGNLFIAVGDNTNPHNPGYYNSIDERKGRENWDAQRTAGNTNDFRGKILRIHPEPNGTYTIPAGNLFAKGQEKTKPEIYVMGTRNPYRINVDQKNGWLYWGDVGQNTVDNPARGPVSYDEWNLATEAGFFGWPYFAGPNSPYADFDFETEKIGPFFNPQKPENNSVNNTGINVLPPAKSALIWYSYDSSKLFPHLGTGGKSPISGPAFHTGLYKDRINDTTRHLHAHYNNKVFIAEWMRDWINVITVTADGKLDSIEPFMRGTKFNHPIDLEIGPDGVLYVLEYGTNWFAKNKDAGLFRIEYMRGDFKPQMKEAAKKENAEPEIYFEVKNGNSSFYWPGQIVNYKIEVLDREDGSLQQGTINADEVKVSLAHTNVGSDVAQLIQAHQRITASQPDFALINTSDCKSCHSMDQKSVGPAYIAIAKKYKKDSATINKLAAKIISGGAGVWGEHAMSAHPQLPVEQSKQIVNYILSLNDQATGIERVKVDGHFSTAASTAKRENYIVTVTYTDKEQPGTKSNTSTKSFHLRFHELPAAAADELSGAKKVGQAVSLDENAGWMLFKQTDLSGIKNLVLDIDNGTGGEIAVKYGSSEGEQIGSAMIPASFKGRKTVPIKAVYGYQDVYVVYKENPGGGSAIPMTVKTITFNNK